MASDRSWEQKAIINELIQGMEVARKLKAELRLASSADSKHLLVQRILSSYDKALLILKWNGINGLVSKSHTMHQATTKSLSPECPISVSRSPPMENDDGALKDHHEHKHGSKKRKMMPKWVNHVKVNSENGFEGRNEDGYSWRKYGQKDILSAKYPKSYYRCTFRKTKGCWATKQVQRSDEDSTIFNITYRGSHTCSQGNNALLPPPESSPDIFEKPHSPSSDIYHTQQSQESPTNFRNMLTVPTNYLADEEMAYPFTSPSPSTLFGCMTEENHSLLPSALEKNSFLCSLSPTHLLSPITPESNYFPSLAFEMNEFDGFYNKACSESDVTEIISANTSATAYEFSNFRFQFLA